MAVMLANQHAESKPRVVAKLLVLLAAAAKLQILAAMLPLAEAASRACSRGCSTSTAIAVVTLANRLAESKPAAVANPAVAAATKYSARSLNQDSFPFE
jgi:hypothetical protein